MAMGEKGMHEMVEMNMEGPINTLPMMGGEGPFGKVAMGGMFTIFKVRNFLPDGVDPEWYSNPPGTISRLVDGESAEEKVPQLLFVCPMHPEVHQSGPGSCPKCGMNLIEKYKK